VDDLVTPALDRGRFDAVGDLAFPLPVLVICEFLGIPSIEQDDVRRRATDLCKAFATQTASPD
jgi:cytochrome P450